MHVDRGSRFCSFCGRSREDSSAVLGAGTGCYICVGCVYDALGVIEAENLRASVHTDEIVEVLGGKGEQP